MEDKQTDEIIELQVDSELLESVRVITAQMGTTPEVLAARFFEWCVNLVTREEAIAWLLKEKQKENQI